MHQDPQVARKRVKVVCHLDTNDNMLSDFLLSFSTESHLSYVFFICQLHTIVVCDGAVEGLCSYARAGAGLQGLSSHRLLPGEGEWRT